MSVEPGLARPAELSSVQTPAPATRVCHNQEADTELQRVRCVTASTPAGGQSEVSRGRSEARDCSGLVSAAQM